MTLSSTSPLEARRKEMIRELEVFDEQIEGIRARAAAEIEAIEAKANSISEVVELADELLNKEALMQAIPELWTEYQDTDWEEHAQGMTSASYGRPTKIPSSANPGCVWQKKIGVEHSTTSWLDEVEGATPLDSDLCLFVAIIEWDNGSFTYALEIGNYWMTSYYQQRLLSRVSDCETMKREVTKRVEKRLAKLRADTNSAVEKARAELQL